MQPSHILRLAPPLLLSAAATGLFLGLLLGFPATAWATPPIEGETHAFNAAVAVSNPAGNVLALAGGDLDRDGRADLAFGVGSTLLIQRNDGSPFDGWDSAVSAGSAADTIQGVAIADLDRDGLPDLATVTGGSGEVRVWRNPGNPFSLAWATSNTLAGTLGSPALAVAAGDLDDDGALDLVVAGTDGTLHLWRNPHTAPFTTSWSTTLTMGGGGAPVNDVILVDLDGDGKLDIASVSGGSEDRVRVWRNDGTPFDSAWTSITLGTSPLGGDGLTVVAGDWNRDGRPDLASGDSAGNITLWRNNGAPFSGGNWGSGVPLIGGSADPVRALLAADLDNDGDLDLISGAAAAVQTWQNPWQGPGDGDPLDGAWSVTSLGSASATVNALVAADLDLDGDADLLSAGDSAANEILAWENSLVHILWKQYPGTSSAIPFATSPGLTINDSISGNVKGVALADLDGDGVLDLVSAGSNGQLTAWENNGAPFGGAWPQHSIGTADRFYAMAVGDLDDDGYDDVIAGQASVSSGYQLVIWHNDGTPFDGAWSSTVISTTAQRVNTVAVADLDNDGRLDIVSGHCTNHVYHATAECPVAIWHNDGNPFGGTWAPNYVAVISYTINSVATGDLDNDGQADIVVGTDADRDWTQPEWPDTATWPDVYQVRAYRNNGTPFAGSWAETMVGRDDAPVSLAVGHHTFWGAEVLGVAVADLDNDEYLDIVSTDEVRADYQVKVWKNDGVPFDGLWRGTAAWIEAPWMSGDVNAGIVTDFNQDGYPDIVTADAFNGTEIIVWENDGTPFGTSTDPITTVISTSTWIRLRVGDDAQGNGYGFSVAAGDLDRDGDADIVEGGGDFWHPDQNQSITAWQNKGGSVQMRAQNTAPSSIAGGLEQNDLLQFVVAHQGRAADHDLESASWRLLLRDSSGAPLSSDAANQLIDTFQIYRDANGDSNWQTTDTPVVTLTSLALVSGSQTIPFTDGDANVRITTSAPVTYFAVIRPKTGAAFYISNTLRLIFDPDADAVIEDRVKDTSVSIRDTQPVSSSQVLFTTYADSLSIETDPYDPINRLGDTQLTSGQVITAYAIARGGTGLFVANVPVTWTLVNMTGSVTATDLVPSADRRSATFIAHGAGTAQIAISSHARNMSTLQVVNSDTSGIITVTSGLLYTVTVVANPTTITANGQTTSTLTATVVDFFNNPVADGTPVTFTTSAGSLPANPYTAVTTGGHASAVLTSSTTLETATVTAVAGTTSGTATVQFVPGSLASIVVSPTTTTLNPGQTQAFQVTGYDAYSHTIPGTTANWSVVNGGGSINSTTGLFTAAVTDGVYVNTVLATTATLTSTASVTVSNVAPNAAVSGPYSGDEGQSITFDGSASFDANYDPLTYTWDFGEGSSGSGITATHIYADGPAGYVITLTVRDDNGASDVDTTTVTIANLAPWDVSIAGPSAVDEGGSITLTGSASDVASDTLSYAWDVDGDGFDDGTGVTLVYTGTDGPADVTLRLRASDEDGGSTTITHPITVANVAPAPTITAPGSTAGGHEVAFTANANDPGQDTFEYSWDWGDGTSGIITTNPVVTHTFEFIGVYTVALSVTDSDGATGQVEQPIDVTSNASDAYGVFLPIILR
jgi:hypothetical protein